MFKSLRSAGPILGHHYAGRCKILWHFKAYNNAGHPITFSFISTLSELNWFDSLQSKFAIWRQALLSLYAGNPPMTGAFSSQGASNIDHWLLLNKLFKKQLIFWWFEMLQCSSDIMMKLQCTLVACTLVQCSSIIMDMIIFLQNMTDTSYLPLRTRYRWLSARLQ